MIIPKIRIPVAILLFPLPAPYTATGFSIFADSQQTEERNFYENDAYCLVKSFAGCIIFSKKGGVI